MIDLSWIQTRDGKLLGLWLSEQFWFITCVLYFYIERDVVLFASILLHVSGSWSYWFLIFSYFAHLVFISNIKVCLKKLIFTQRPLDTLFMLNNFRAGLSMNLFAFISYFFFWHSFLMTLWAFSFLNCKKLFHVSEAKEFILWLHTDTHALSALL